MIIAAIADIHGNIVALNAVLEDIDRRGADIIVNLGDLVSGPLWPYETLQRLIPLGLPTIRGNHERQLLSLARHDMGASDAYAHDAITPEQRSWLLNLDKSLKLQNDILLVHGTPASDLEYMLETITPKANRAATSEEVRQRLGGAQARLILCAHTHIQREIRIAGGPCIVNPGSVGLPAYEDDIPFPHRMEAGTPHARYAIIDISAHDIKTQFISLPYNWDKAAARAETNERADWARALATGSL